MNRRTRVRSSISGAHFVTALGGVFVAIAAVRASLVLSAAGSLTEALIDLLLIGVPGIVLVYGGYRLPRTDVHPDVYPRIVAWCLGGLVTMLGVVALIELNPAVDIDGPLRARALAMGLGAAVGFAIGTNEARAITRARVAERRALELAALSDELEDTVDQLETSNDRLERFAYAASHDMQEPLRMISSYLRLLERRYADDLDEDGEEFLAFAVDGADRMHAMIEDLLTYSTIDAPDLTFEPVDCEAVVGDAMAELEPEIERADAELTVDALPTVVGDRERLRVLFVHLLSNAITYSGDRRPRVRIYAEQDDADEHWTIAVADRGIGIDPEYRDQIFEMFRRLHSRSAYPGTGIGLALCERIVEVHGGDIWVESEPGSGSTFYVTLPSRVDRDGDPERIRRRGRRSSSRSDRNRSRT